MIYLSRRCKHRFADASSSAAGAIPRASQLNFPAKITTRLSQTSSISKNMYSHLRSSKTDRCMLIRWGLEAHASRDHTLAGPLWEGCRESRRCFRDTYPESYITKYTSTRKVIHGADEIINRCIRSWIICAVIFVHQKRTDVLVLV